MLNANRIDPPQMNTRQLLLVSTVGLAVNLFGMFAMGGHAHHVSEPVFYKNSGTKLPLGSFTFSWWTWPLPLWRRPCYSQSRVAKDQ